MAGVSRTTVSFVLNRLQGVSISEGTRERVWEAAKKLNYHPNAAGRQLVSGKSSTLGLVLYQSPEQVFADAFLPRVILGVEQAAVQQKSHVLLKSVEPGDTEGYSRLIHENDVDGIILSGPRQDDTEILRLHADGVPIMLLGQLPHTELCFVDVNAITGAESATGHLLDLGHRRIGMITNAPLSYTSAQQGEPHSLWHALRDMLHTRKKHRSFGWGELDWLECHNDRIAAYRRLYRDESILALQNLNDSEEKLSLELDRTGTLKDLLTGREYGLEGNKLRLELNPYEYLWLERP